MDELQTQPGFSRQTSHLASASPFPNARLHRGFTLIEATVTVAILAIVVGLAIPSLADFIRSTRVNKLSNEFTSSLTAARATALNRNMCVTMCTTANPNAAAPNCATSNPNWGAGWILFANPDCNNSALGTADELLQVYEGDLNGVTLSGEVSTFTITFNSRGVLNAIASAGAFTVSNEDVPLKTVCLDAAGRARTGDYGQAGFCQ